MTSARIPFRLETVQLDLPKMAAAFCRRLHDAGLPVTPARAADLTRALALVRPVSRRRLYFTARAVLVADPVEVPVFDAVFAGVFGGVRADGPPSPDDVRTAPVEEDDRDVPAPRTAA